MVIDIGRAHQALKAVLDKINYKNLDDESQFQGQLTTTEYIARYIHQEIARHLSGKFAGSLKITLGESHIAWASFEDNIDL